MSSTEAFFHKLFLMDVLITIQVDLELCLKAHTFKVNFHFLSSHLDTDQRSLG